MGRPATTTTSKTTAANTNGNAKRIVYRRPRKDSSEVSPLIKYLLFIFNVLFWVIIIKVIIIIKNLKNYYFLKQKQKLVGFAVFGIGIYAWIEKDTFNKLTTMSIGVLFDPAFVFLVVGLLVFIIGFCGCVGALRENTNLLLIVIIYLFFLNKFCNS